MNHRDGNVAGGESELYCGQLWDTFYFINLNYFGNFERMDSAVPQHSARVC